MGVWIETLDARVDLVNAQSHPVWVCGLKLLLPFVLLSAWLSHPVWVCGLKPCAVYEMNPGDSSHPVWVCGLKLHISIHLLNLFGHTLYGCVD